MIIPREETRTKKHISRKTAQEMVREMLERIPTIDAMESWTQLTAIIVFGSYLDEEEKLGDVDLIVLNNWKSKEEVEQELDKNGAEGIDRTFARRNVIDKEQNIMASVLQGKRRFFSFHTYMTLPQLIAHNRRENRSFQYKYLYVRSPEMQKIYDDVIDSWVERFIEKPDLCVI